MKIRHSLIFAGVVSLLSFLFVPFCVSCSASNGVGDLRSETFSDELNYKININESGRYLVCGFVDEKDDYNVKIKDFNNNNIDVDYLNTFEVRIAGTYSITITPNFIAKNVKYYGGVASIRDADNQYINLTSKDNNKYVAFQFYPYSNGAPSVIEGSEYINFSSDNSVPLAARLPSVFGGSSKDNYYATSLNRYGKNNYHYSSDVLNHQGRKSYFLARFNNVPSNGGKILLSSICKIHLGYRNSCQTFIDSNTKVYYYCEGLKPGKQYCYYIQTGQGINVPTRILDNDLNEISSSSTFTTSEDRVIIECSPIQNQITVVDTAFISETRTIDNIAIHGQDYCIDVASDMMDSTIEYNIDNPYYGIPHDNDFKFRIYFQVTPSISAKSDKILSSILRVDGQFYNIDATGRVTTKDIAINNFTKNNNEFYSTDEIGGQDGEYKGFSMFIFKKFTIRFSDSSQFSDGLTLHLSAKHL